ncbi:MAG TPA: MFS transporter [Ktedonobacteraceae bacterium]|nr:MFS transporter [Ktedonobacteraceae bacterium]
MLEETDLTQPRGIAIPTETGYQVMEGKGALVNRNSVIFAVGQGISLIGDNIYLSTLIIWISAVTLAAAQTPAQKLAVAATVTAIQAGIFGANYLAGFLIIPFVGVFVDRWNRRTTMIIADLGQAVLALLPLIAFLVAKNVFIPAIYVTYFLLVAAQGFFMGSQSGVLQVIVARKSFPQAVSILTVLVGVGAVAGFALAPAFFIAVGPIIAITFNALSFVISAIALFLLRIPEEAVHPYAFRQRDDLAAVAGIGKSIAGVFKDLWRGLRFVFTTRVLFGIIIMLIVVQIGAAAVNSLTSGLFFANLHASPTKDLALIGLLPTALGAGGIIGAILVGVLARFFPLKALAIVGILGIGLGLINIAFLNNVTSGVIFYFIAGIFNNLFVVSYSSLVIKITPNSIIGRVEGVLAPLATFSSFISAFVVGAIVAAYNPALNPKTPFPNSAVLFTDIFVISGIVIVVASVLGFLLLRKAQEEVTGIEKLAIAPTPLVASEPPIIAGEGGN